jgi:ubiquitin-like protein Nedd8
MGFFSRLRRVLSFRPKKPPVETPRPPEACLQQVPANEQSIPTPNSRDLFQEAGFLISIETLKGEIFFIRVQSTHTVSQVKAQIEKRRGFPVELQRLVYDEKQLEDEHTVEETRIHTHGTVYLVLHARPTPLADVLLVNAPAEARSPATVSQQPTKRHDSGEAGAATGVPLLNAPRREGVRINVRDTDTITKPVVITGTTEGEELEVIKVRDTDRITKPVLMNGTTEEEELEFPIVRDTDTITKQVVITETTDGEELEFTFRATDRVAKLKSKIKERAKLPTELQQLYFSGQLLSDKDILSDYGILDKAKLQLALHLETGHDNYRSDFVRLRCITNKFFRGYSFTLNVVPSDTIRDVKQKIKNIQA